MKKVKTYWDEINKTKDQDPTKINLIFKYINNLKKKRYG